MVTPLPPSPFAYLSPFLCVFLYSFSQTSDAVLQKNWTMTKGGHDKMDKIGFSTYSPFQLSTSNAVFFLSLILPLADGEETLLNNANHEAELVPIAMPSSLLTIDTIPSHPLLDHPGCRGLHFFFS